MAPGGSTLSTRTASSSAEDIYSLSSSPRDEDTDDDSEDVDEDEDERQLLLVEQYAHRLLDFSMQYGSAGSHSYTALNLLGKPTKFPSYGDYPQTYILGEFGLWPRLTPSGKAGRRPWCRTDHCCQDWVHFVDLKYNHATFVHAVYVYETFTPGAVTAVYAGDCHGRWFELWCRPSATQSPVQCQPRAFAPPVKSCPFTVHMLRIIFDITRCSNHIGIDAVALLGSTKPGINPSYSSAAQDSIKAEPVVIDAVDQVMKLGLSAITCEGSPAETLTELDLLHKEAASIGESGEGDVTSFHCLPRETLIHIFSYLDVISLCRCSRTCKLFESVAADPQLYTSLCLKSVFPSVTSKCLDSLSRRCSFLSRLDLSWCGNYGSLNGQALAEFFSSCGRNLVHLRLGNCHSITQNVLAVIAAMCSNLAHLDLSACHLLQSQDFEPLAKLRNLVYLNLYFTHIGSRHLADIIRSNAKLTHLNLSCCQDLLADEICVEIEQHLPRLESLQLLRNSRLTEAGLQCLSSLSALSELDIGWCRSINLSSGSLIALLQHCTRLERLSLAALRQVTDTDLMAMTRLASLEQLDLMGARFVTLGGLQTLLDSVPDLTFIDVSYCEQLQNSIMLADLCSRYPQCKIVYA